MRTVFVRLAILLLASLPAAFPQSDLEVELKRFTEVLAAVEREAADPVPVGRILFEGAIPGMLKGLDPHSAFLDPDQFQQLKEMERSTRKGFGSVVSVLPGRVIVLQTLEGTPSARSGIAPGDEIVVINNIPLNRLDTEQLIALLTYSRQKEVRLLVRRPGNVRLFDFVLTPEDMQSPSVERAFLLQSGVGYLRVSSFDAATGKEIRQAIESLGGEKLRGLVLDLRNNPGGVLPAALETAALFLKPGQKVLSVLGRAVEGQEIKVPDDARPYEFPVSVILNGKSASGSEIVAGAIQDHDRGRIVGEPSYGKGLVQTVYPLSQGAALALTTAFYYTPSGRSIQKPLEGQLDSATARQGVAAKQEYRTDTGRVVIGGGGIVPDELVLPEGLTRFRAVLDATASFTTFATDLKQQRGPVTEDFEVTPALLDEFQAFLSARNIRPGLAEWSQEREWISSRLKTEIFNLSLGVEKGDEVEAQRDPQVRKAVEALRLDQR